MQAIADFLFEARMLKATPRSGYQFLGNGRESVAEHSFSATLVAMVLSRLVNDIDLARLLAMCLVHDLPEARTGDLNYVNKRYVIDDHLRALNDCVADLPFGDWIKALVSEFDAGESREARLARDADQLAFILDLKAFQDCGFQPATKWLPYVVQRLQTTIGKELARSILATEQDHWWLKNYVDNPGQKK
jgi:putative hydrolase of HD superfamily